MVPTLLKLSNFTSYGENPPELDFSKFHLAAISGQNGAGKSSLLDSITWCIWGVSRAGDSSDDLVRLGQTEMHVELSFQLDGNSYTVKRRRSKKSGGHTALEFWSNSHNLTEGTIKATQQKIIDTLHLTFETFSNSAFLRQGHADEFTTKGPTDRKRILADILGLDHYDKLEEKAKEKSKESQTKLSLLDYQLLEIETELSQKEEREKKLTQIEEEGKIAQKELKDKETEVKNLEEEKQRIEKQIETLREQGQRFKEIKKELDELKIQVELKNKAKEEYQNILNRKTEIETAYQSLQDLQKQKQDLESKRSTLIKFKDELVEVQKKLLDRENKRNEAVNKIEIEITQLQTENTKTSFQLEALKNKKDICPTCGQIINQEKNKSLIEENQKLIDKNDKKVNELKSTIDKYKSIVLPEEKLVKDKELEVKKIEDETQNWTKVNNEIQDLQKVADDYLKLNQAEIGVKSQQETIDELEKIIKSKELEIQKSEKFENNLNTFLEALRINTQKLASQIILKDELTEKVLELRGKYGEAKQLVSRAEQLENLLKDKKTEKDNLTKEKEIYDELSLAFGKKGIQAMIIEQAIPEIEAETNTLLEKLTEGRMKVALITQKETKTKVVGAEGIKEHATVETLDIVISDEMGDRPYEMYSGGETFRVNFAIRLAISRLLTHRAGAKLQFLVIDEGFGTQDATGRTRLVETMDTIKNDFEKILIITHLEELKEEFPTRIEVAKGSTGSTFEVIGT